MDQSENIQPKNINSTLLNIEQEMNTSNYKDATAFDIDADIKQELLYERKQFKPLAKDFMEFLTLGVRQHAVIIGPKGSGKTAIVKYILKEAKRIPKMEFDYMYINCRNLDSSYKVMKGVLKEKKKVPKDQVMSSFVEKIQENNKVFLILDEVDLMRDDDLIYDITRRTDLNNVLLVMITKTPKMYDNLSGDVKSSIKFKTFFFDTYDYLETKEILSKRAQEGLKGWCDHILLKVAISNVQVANSDIRIGIKALEQLFKGEEYPKATLDKNKKPIIPAATIKKIDELMSSQYVKMKEGLIRNLQETKRTVLYFALKYKNSNIAYTEFRSKSYTTLSKSNFFRHIDELAYMDLFQVRRIRQGRFAVLQFIENIGKKNLELLKKLVVDDLLIRKE